MGSLISELVQTSVYKRSQGRVARQVTFAAAAISVSLGTWRLREFLVGLDSDPYIQFGIPGVLLLAGLWLSYRIVNITRFADFLIAVEAEMNKVTWPSRTELFRSSLVVMLVIFFLAAVLFFFDLIWQALFQWIGVLRS